MATVRSRLIVRFAREWLYPQWGWFALGLLFSVLTAAAAFGYAETTTRAVDWLESGDPRIFTIAPIAVIALTFVRSLALYGQTQMNNHGVQAALVDLQRALFGRLIDGDFSRLQTAASGEYVSQFVNDVAVLREAALRTASNLAKSALTIIACVGFMLVRDWPLALFLLVAYPIAFYPVIRLGERIRKSSRAAQEQAGDLTALLSESFQGARTIKAFSLEAYQKQRAGQAFRDRARLYLKVLRSKAMVDPFLETVGGLALAGLFAFAGWRTLAGEASVGEVIGFITAIAIASPEVRALGTLNAVVNEGLAAAERMYRLMDAPAETVDERGAAGAGAVRGGVRFENIRFAYPGGDAVLNGLNFTAEPGRMTAIVGPSGAGKSTVFNLLLRLYEPDAGRILLDGEPISDLSLVRLRGSMALVAQDAFLFDVSVRENVALGRRGASEAEMRAAAEAAACDFIDSLPQGWETRVGEGGRLLSGGQRQRIALARALLSGAPVLLLDEATSALDSDSESRIQTALDRLGGSRTVIVIAHRLATVRRADAIIVIDGGLALETGRHEELIDAQGAYARLASLQLS